MSASLRIAALISGGGRTVLNLQDEIDGGRLEAKIVAVIAHSETIPGVARARARGLPVAVVSKSPVDSLGDRLNATIEASNPTVICLCGYLRHLKIAPQFRGRVLNIHPSLLPDFGGQGMYGIRVHRAVLEAGCDVTGCTVHEVDEIYDHGPALLQRQCEVLPNDTPESLAARVFALECEALPEALRHFAERLAQSAQR